MTSSEVAIANLLYRYAEMVDAGRFEDLASELFAHARFIVAPPPAGRVSGATMAGLIAATTIRYEDGTPRTRHLVTNPVIEVDEQAGVAACRSCYTVLQHTPTLALQPIVAGRYHDRFGRIEGEWCFTERDYTMIDMVGDTSQHLRLPPSGTAL
ncbi:MAG TPA: nuclear transport factor 2 family protein [Acidimicrobiales bacterium]|nr:nuclear transport factor 2 family protein [Acidimicrobiales bacterium]